MKSVYFIKNETKSVDLSKTETSVYLYYIVLGRSR